MALGIAANHAYVPTRGGDIDEDALTMALEAAAPIAMGEVAFLSLASTSLPYARRVQAGMLSGALGLGTGLFVTEHTTSERAGTEALITQVGLLRGQPGARVLVVAAATVAVALLLADEGDVARVEGVASYASDDPGLKFTRSGEDRLRDVQVADYTAAAYTEAVRGAAGSLLRNLGRSAADYRFVVLNPPEPQLARRGAEAIGAGAQQCQAATEPLQGLASALDAARPGDRILLVAYGSGSAADAISLVVGRGEV